MNADTCVSMYSIVQIAKDTGLILKIRKNRPNEYTANCPFCNDRKSHLSVHGQRNVFYCYRCNESGGFLRFYALLHKMDEHSAKETLRRKRQISSYNPTRVYRHPAENLSAEEIRELGFLKIPNWYALKKQDPIRTKALADWIWKEKQTHDKQKNKILKFLIKELQTKSHSDSLTK